jgi:L-fuconolactonase
MFGSDWPVCLMAGDYMRVWEESVRVLEGLLPAAARDAVLGGTAVRVYRLAV